MISDKFLYEEVESMVKNDWDVIVVGGGIAGLTITALLSKLNYRVLCIEPQKPPAKEMQATADLRSTAYLINSIELFKESGVWECLKDRAEQLKVMRICDTGGANGITQESSFDSKEIGLSQFGYNIPNWFAKNAIISVIKSSKTSQILFGTKAIGITNLQDKSILRLSNKKKISTKLIVAADGKNSDIRFLSKIAIKKWDDGQDAIACAVTHEKKHDGTSIELLESGGPCTLVPLQNTEDGKFQSAVVWVDKRVQAKNLMLLSDRDFSIKLSNRTKNILGTCKLNSGRSIYPIVTQLADKFYGERLALIAESAHVMPPIGAQGLNTSFEDISLLVNLLKKASVENADIGNPYLLTKYGKIRRRISKSKMLAITLLNTASKANLPLTKSFRKFGLTVIEKNALVKNTLMKAGLGKF